MLINKVLHIYTMAEKLRSARIINEQILNLPHTKEGHIDYRTLGNMTSAALLGEVFHGSCVDFEHSDSGRDSCRQESGGWRYYYKEDEIVILRKRLPNSKICSFMGRGVVDAPLDQVASYLHKFQNRLEWDPTIIQIEVCQQYSENDWLLYMSHEAKRQCFFTSYRDFLYYSRTGYVSSMSVVDKDYPHRPPYIRAEIMMGTGWVVEKYNNSECSSLITYVAQLDLKELPAVVLNRVLRRQPLSIKYIRQKLMSPKLPLTISLSSPPTKQSSRFPQHVSITSSEDYCYEESVSMSNFVPFPEEENVKSAEMYPWIVDRQKHKTRAATVSTCTSSHCSSNDNNMEMSLPTSTVNTDQKQNGHVVPQLDNETLANIETPANNGTPASNDTPDPASNETPNDCNVSCYSKTRCFSTSLPNNPVIKLRPSLVRLNSTELGCVAQCQDSSVDQNKSSQQANADTEEIPSWQPQT